MNPPSTARLVWVELRKAHDTRAGFWLLLILGLLGAAVVVLLLAFGKDETVFEDLLLTAQLPIGIFLPVLGILAVTSEWAQRTALTTFTLVPRRSRVMVAKILALVALALLAVAISIVAAALGNVYAEAVNDAPGSWGSVSTLGRVALFQVVMVLVGVGLGMLLLSAPQAIVSYLLLPTLLAGLASLVAPLRVPARWVDLNGTVTRLLGEPMDGRAWAQIAASVAAWVVLPMLLGAVRIQRREVQ